MENEMTKNVIAQWVAERDVSANGMHEIREGAVNERERPLVGYAATYEQARSIADAHNNSAAVAELIAAMRSIESMTSTHGRIEAVRTKRLNEKARAALARATQGAPTNGK
jgi:hypothetical protein